VAASAIGRPAIAAAWAVGVAVATASATAATELLRASHDEGRARVEAGSVLPEAS
jgi:hypothetical protein